MIEFVSISGSKSIDNRVNENNPKTAMPRNIRIVVIGRFTADWYKLIVVGFQFIFSW